MHLGRAGHSSVLSFRSVARTQVVPNDNVWPSACLVVRATVRNQKGYILVFAATLYTLMFRGKVLTWTRAVSDGNTPFLAPVPVHLVCRYVLSASEEAPVSPGG